MFQKKKPAKLGFRKWLILEQGKQKILEATEGVEFPQAVLDYLSVAFDLPVKKFEKDSWENTVFSLAEAFDSFAPDPSLPLIKDAPKKSKDTEWEYEGRSWNFYSHILASAYSWTLEYIALLDVNEALGHIQEVLTDEHLEREFAYSLSEVAYPYNKSTKRGEFKPMPRPYWMRPVHREAKKIKMKRSLLPVGVGVDNSGLPESYGIKELIASGQRENNETQEADSPRSP